MWFLVFNKIKEKRYYETMIDMDSIPSLIYTKKTHVLINVIYRVANLKISQRGRSEEALVPKRKI